MDREKVEMGIKGFRVQFSKSTVTLPNPGAVLAFDRLICNVDNCYNPSSGVFTAPRTGAYAFYVSGVIATDDQHGYSDLVLEKTASDHPLQKIFLRGRGDIYVSSQGSFHVRVKLQRGEQVQLRHLKGDLGFRGENWTTFSGVLEFEYTDDSIMPPS